MVTKKNPPQLVYGLISDDVRNEVDRKTSLIGISTGDIVVPIIPHVFGKICFHLVFKGVKGGDAIKVQLKGPSENSVASPVFDRIEIPKAVPEVVQEGTCVLQLIMGLLGIKEEGVYHLLFFLNDEEKVFGNFDFRVKAQRTE